MVPLLVVIGVIVLVVLIVVVIYNRLITLRNRVNQAWAQIDVQLRRRYDLIPNLVETVKGYAAHERETFEQVTEARSRCIDAGTVPEQGQAENMLSGALRRLFALVENYPDLKANQNFLQLQEELTSTENKIGFSRQHYNKTTAQYNEAIAVFPNNVLAGMFSFNVMDFFELDDEAQREAPKVQF